MNVTE